MGIKMETMKNPESIQLTPARLKEIRLRMGLSQDAFAKLMGLERKYISRRESGYRPIKQWFAKAVKNIENNV